LQKENKKQAYCGENHPYSAIGKDVRLFHWLM